MLNANGQVEFEYVDYKQMIEIEFAKKYFDWEFYSKKSGFQIHNESDCYDYLLKLGFSPKDTLYDIEKNKRRDYAKQMSYDNLAEEEGDG